MTCSKDALTRKKGSLERRKHFRSRYDVLFYVSVFSICLCIQHVSTFLPCQQTVPYQRCSINNRLIRSGGKEIGSVQTDASNVLTENQGQSLIEKTRINSHTTNRIKPGLLSPWHILLKQTPTQDKTDPLLAIVSRKRSLDFALLLLKKAIDEISNDKNEIDSPVIQILNENSLESNGMRILRLEVPIVSSTTVDPLAWLTAQEEYLSRLQNIVGTGTGTPSMFYLKTHENTLESATIGNAIHWNSTYKLWNNLNEVLPFGSFVYGGHRFDHRLSSDGDDATPGNCTIGHEWKPFGHAYWMLPEVELRHRLIQGSVTTLAVHLVCLQNQGGWKFTAASLMERLLSHISSSQEVRAAPSSLPPILSRSSTVRDRTMDGQELYENAFDAAMHQFELAASSGDCKGLQKVVLARQQTLHFGTNFRSSLDIIRRWKYGGHEGGHLFWLKPHTSTLVWKKQEVSHEYLGCTPERLFQILTQHDKKGTKSLTLVRSEALAGTRPRGLTQQEDEMLLQELLTSPKDMSENTLTGDYIEAAFDQLFKQKMIKKPRNAIWRTPTIDDIEEGSAFGEYSSKVAEVERFPNASIIPTAKSTKKSSYWSQGFYVRRLLHLQHICQSYTAELLNDEDNKRKVSPSSVMKTAQFLLTTLHPTPAVCGVPPQEAFTFLKKYESVGFDRGFYSGPIGYIGRDEADILVGLRCGLALTSNGQFDASNESYRFQRLNPTPLRSEIISYAGGGIVPASKLREEWAETNYKFAVIASLFPQSPITLRSATTPNVAWATALIEELIRSGVTRFYICPGSRSTPLVAAIARAARGRTGGSATGGMIQAISVLDERAAAFRALGYGRGAGRPAAVITSSGTAVANLYPAVIEAGMDGIPILLLTADRPYESRDSGANQAIDQVKIFSNSYIRWFRDILPPSHDVPVSVALSDASHAVQVCRELRGPVHLNIQFRENLAPDAGNIRNDNRVDSVIEYNGVRFTDIPGFQRWSATGQPWSKTYSQGVTNLGYLSTMSTSAALDVAELIKKSKRGIIIVGNLRLSGAQSSHTEQSSLAQTIADFAELIGFPVFAGIQSGNLRFISAAVVPFAEHLLKNKIITENLDPDLIIQVGAPMVSTGITELLSRRRKPLENCKDEECVLSRHHVLIHPQWGHERADPTFTVSHRVSADISPFLSSVCAILTTTISAGTLYPSQLGSQLAPIILLGRKLQLEMKSIIHAATENIPSQNMYNDSSVHTSWLSEPQLVLGIAEVVGEISDPMALFLSNSMPVRDAEFFFYPYTPSSSDKRGSTSSSGFNTIGVNRGASGIDGIISSALGFCEAIKVPTSLLVGDVATLHDIGSLHSVVNSAYNSNQASLKRRLPLSTIIVNNDGGGIFSFLPIAGHGSDVGFDEYFGTPTNSFSFQMGAKAFGIQADKVDNYSAFVDKYREMITSNKDSILEAVVVTRDRNVEIHKEITRMTQAFVNDQLISVNTINISPERLPYIAVSGTYNSQPSLQPGRTLLLLHGWMGDKLDWREAVSYLSENLSSEWTILSVDLPGHGGSMLRSSEDVVSLRMALNINDKKDLETDSSNFDVDALALAVLNSIAHHHSISQLDAVAGYSLGGRVAMAMKRLSSIDTVPNLIRSNTSLILLGANPGITSLTGEDLVEADRVRQNMDNALAADIEDMSNRAFTFSSMEESTSIWYSFLNAWYSAPIWGSLKTRSFYSNLVLKRAQALNRRGRDIASILSNCSPNHGNDDYIHCNPDRTLYIAGKLDPKYSALRSVVKSELNWRTKLINGAGHSLLAEAPQDVAKAIADFIVKGSERIPDLDGETSSFGGLIESNQIANAVIQDVFQDMLATAAAPLLEVDRIVIGTLVTKDFSVSLCDDNKSDKRISGIGWGQNARSSESNKFSTRQGSAIQLESLDGNEVGIGEVSPLPGLHSETLSEAHKQILLLKSKLEESAIENRPMFSPREIMLLDGAMSVLLTEIAEFAGIQHLFPSVQSGIEMCILALSSQKIGQPIYKAIVPENIRKRKMSPGGLQISGLITRGSSWKRVSSDVQAKTRKFPSIKVKVGHQNPREDAISMLQGFQGSQVYQGRASGFVRADANQAWNESEAVEFALALEGVDVHATERIEFIEEPLQRLRIDDWTVGKQIEALERTFFRTGIKYALDETIAELCAIHHYDFAFIEKELSSVFASGPRGCAAFVLKPAVIGMELSIRIARMARMKLGIGCVFSSCFESGLGLAYISFLGHLADQLPSAAQIFPHGIGTFTMLERDIMTPGFDSFVSENGVLNIPSLSRALYGLSLDEIYLTQPKYMVPTETPQVDPFEASAATSSSGNEISVTVHLPLPFSAGIATARFTDLPSMSRWSPWISSVQYQGTETEWTVNVRGIPLKWRAESRIVNDPFPGIEWQSVSGLKNNGIVEFIPLTSSSCSMNVRMTIVTPRLLKPLFQGTSIFVEEFLRDKLLKWSLEMFRDVVKADLAIERGDVELGDALIGAVEGKATAIEATLNSTAL